MDNWSWHIDIAGAMKDTIDFSVRDGQLRVQGRRQIRLGKRRRAIPGERLYGRFVRFARLPPGLGVDQLSIRFEGTRLEVRAHARAVVGEGQGTFPGTPP